MSDELKTQVFLIKTADDQDAVIVSFVDGGDVNGIYLHEPGADPVELLSVGVEQPGNADEYGTVVGDVLLGLRLVNGDQDTEEREWPGEEMVLASALDEVRDAAEERETELTTLREAAISALDALTESVRRMHNESDNTSGHPGAFVWCQHAVCTQARESSALADEETE